MEPISIIVGALAMGAAAATKKVGGQIGLDAYNALKRLISDRYEIRGAVAALEQGPPSEMAKVALIEVLAKTMAPTDAEVIERAKYLLSVLETVPHADLVAVGIKISELTAINARFGEVSIIGSGTGISIDKLNAQGDVMFDGVRIQGPN